MREFELLKIYKAAKKNNLTLPVSVVEYLRLFGESGINGTYTYFNPLFDVGSCIEPKLGGIFPIHNSSNAVVPLEGGALYEYVVENNAFGLKGLDKKDPPLLLLNMSEFEENGGIVTKPLIKTIFSTNVDLMPNYEIFFLPPNSRI